MERQRLPGSCTTVLCIASAVVYSRLNAVTCVLLGRSWVGRCFHWNMVGVLSCSYIASPPGSAVAVQVSFGHVVNSPLPPQRPLALAQPHEGCKVVSDSNSRYEFELHSGTVTSCSSEALQLSSNLLLSAARLVGLWRRPAVAAVHELVVQAPDGTARTFRVGTATADVPAQLGERVTVVCAPNKGSNKLRRLVLSTNPPGTQPGEPMLISNHKTGAELQLLRPPPAGSQSAAPGWVLPAAVMLASADAASGLVDPVLPMLITGVAWGVGCCCVFCCCVLVVLLRRGTARQLSLQRYLFQPGSQKMRRRTIASLQLCAQTATQRQQVQGFKRGNSD